MTKQAGKLPTAAEIIQFLSKLEGQPASKREIAKEFRIKGQEARVDLKFLLKDMVLDGLIAHDKAKTFTLPKERHIEAGAESIHLKVTTMNQDGELMCEPLKENLIDDYPTIILDTASNAAVGDTLVANLHPINDGEFLATEIKKPKKEPSDDKSTLMGVYRERVNGPAVFMALSKELSKIDFVVPTLPKDMKIKDGAVLNVKVGKRPQFGPTPVEVLEVISNELKGTEIAIGIRNHELPHTFPEEVISYAQNLKPVSDTDLKDREDLRHIPIVTIDGEDAKDFDDAVWAEPWENEKVKGGFHIIVAIADVAHYVKEGTPLDKEAFVRGNSVYFPGFVIPMLPEELSNDLCSLRPHEDRPTMVAHMWIDADGKLKKYKFTRAVIHSHARLTYNQVQEALNGDIPDVVKPVMETTIAPLFMAYKALLKNRSKRGALDLDVPETVIMMDDTGEITKIDKRSRFESHQLIEEMMVLANVAAASELQTKGAPCLYRIHPEPSELKMEALKLSFKDFGLKFGGDVSPLAIQNTLKNARDENKDALYMTVLRSLEQARYDPENVGHFGLALERYAHFTSPIRRYSDLVVHRSLINSLKLSGYKQIDKPKNLIKVADHLCITERRAQKAEWEVKDRLTVRYYSEFVGKQFKARITTLTKFGMFLAIDDGAAEGMMPYRFMNDDHYIYNEQKNSLTGKRTKRVIKVGHNMVVKLIEADAVTGRLTFAPEGAKAEDLKDDRRGRRGKLYGRKASDKRTEKDFKGKPKAGGSKGDKKPFKGSKNAKSQSGQKRKSFKK